MIPHAAGPRSPDLAQENGVFPPFGRRPAAQGATRRIPA